MEWYEIIGFLVIWIAGLWLSGKFYERLRNRNKNGSWRKRGK
jgi:biotin transporter BioY